MPLNAQVIVEILNLISNPPLMCEAATALFFPETHAEFQKWNNLQMRPDFGATYDWFRVKFPGAPERVDDSLVGELYREMLKHIIAKALNVEYKTVSKILMH